MSERQAAKTYYLLNRRITSIAEKGLVAIVTGPDVGSPQMYHTRTTMDVNRFFREYSKGHGMYISEKGETFSLYGMFHRAKSAKMHAKYLSQHKWSCHIIISSINSSRELDEYVTRSELDERGHHYMLTPTG